jgi:hypothetical protein
MTGAFRIGGVTLACLLATSAGAARLSYPQLSGVGDKPTFAEAAAVRHVYGQEWADTEKEEGHRLAFAVGHADLNGDGLPDLLVRLSDSTYCGSHGCSTYALLATPAGYAEKGIDLAISIAQVAVLPTLHKGMHDLRFDESSYVYTWTGQEYR